MKSPIKTEKSKAHLPLPTLLSQALVAFTIEFDNEFEQQMPHRTTASRTKASQSATSSPYGPWLVSLVMYSNFMQFIREDGIRIRDLQRLARMTKDGLDNRLERMARWWGYVTVAPDPADTRPDPPRTDWVVRPSVFGKKTLEIWRPLFGVIENRWQSRFGSDKIDTLRQSLGKVRDQLDADLPEYLPVLGYGLFSRVLPQEGLSAAHPATITRDLHLPALLSQVLLAFAIDFENESDLSLAMSANVLRLLTEAGVPMRDLPHLSGVSKEAIKMSLGYMEKHLYLTIQPDPTNNRTKLVRLTPIGRKAQDAYHHRLRIIEEHWQTRFGSEAIQNLRESLEQLVGEPTSQRSTFFGGLDPHPNGWRASIPKPETLPHYPMVLHRGGFPDGA